jgi:hypothetical protein
VWTWGHCIAWHGFVSTLGWVWQEHRIGTGMGLLVIIEQCIAWYILLTTLRQYRTEGITLVSNTRQRTRFDCWSTKGKYWVSSGIAFEFCVACVIAGTTGAD